MKTEVLGFQAERLNRMTMIADVAESVDATDLKSVFRMEVGVRVPPSAPFG